MTREYFSSIVHIGDDRSTRCYSPFPSTLLKFSDAAPNSVCDLWNPGVYSNFDIDSSQKPFKVLNEKCLDRRLTVQSDSGNESVDTNFSEDEFVTNTKSKKINKDITIYDLMKSESRKRQKDDDVILNIFINHDLHNERRIEARNRKESEGMNEDYKVVPWGWESRPVGKIDHLIQSESGFQIPIKSKDSSVNEDALYSASETPTGFAEDNKFGDDEDEKARPLIVNSVILKNPRIPVWKSKFLENQEKINRKMDSGISAASFTFYDQYGIPQKSLSQRVSAHLLRKSAIRSSIPRSRRQDHNHTPKYDKPALSYQHDEVLVYPRRPQILPEQKRRSSSVHNRPREDNVITVHGKTKCSSCQYQLGRGQAMVITDLGLFYHMGCFVCARCKVPLNNDRSQGDLAVRVFDDQLRCSYCFDRSEAGFKSSRI